MSPPSSRVSAGSSSATALAMSTVLPLLDLLTEMPTDASPLVRVIAVSGAGAIFTVATSPRRTGPPVEVVAPPPAAAATASAVAPAEPAAPAAAPPDAVGPVAAEAALEGASTSCSSSFSVSAFALTVMG